MSRFGFAKQYRASNTQLFRYALVGIVSNLAGYFVYLLLTSQGSTPKLTMTFLYGVGAGIGFIGHRNLTFSDKGNVLGSGSRYMVAHLFGYLMNFAMLFIFSDKLGYPHQLVQSFAILVVAGFLFVTFKVFVFQYTNPSHVERR